MSTYDEGKNPCTSYAKKINEEFVVEKGGVNEEAASAMVVAAFYHGDAFESVIWSPNWRQQSQRYNFPTGFQFAVHRTAAVHAPLFSQSEMFAVQMAFPLDAGVKSSMLTTGAKADDAHFIGNQQTIAERLNTSIDNTLLSASSPMNFSGIFATEQRTATGYDKKLYAVARFSSGEVGDKIYEKIVAAKTHDRDASIDYAHALAQHNNNEDPQYVGIAGGAPPHTTWHELFVKDSEMLALRKQQTETCASILLRTLHACGLGAVAASTSAPQNVSALLNSPALVKSVINDVDHIASTNKLVYLSEMTSINNAANGIVFQEVPQLGITIFKNVREPAPTKSTTPLIGLPCNVGPVRSIDAHRQLKAYDKTELVLRSPFVWDVAAGGPHNILLSTSLYRQSKNAGWLQSATKLGLTDVECDALYLKPVVVKMATPDIALAKK